MAWTDAATYFDGCGVVFLSQQPMYDYRVRGDFEGVHPSVVLVVRAVERVEVVLTLTQKDKRGVPITEPDAKLSPMLLCVSRGDGNKQRIDCCSGSDPETTSDEYNFVVAREVGLRYIFEPSDAPYFVVPRIHRKGTTDVRQKEFVLGVRAATPLDGKLDVQFTKLDRNSRVFANRVSFVVEDTTEVIRPFQTKAPGEAVVTDAGSKLSQAQLPTPAAQDEEEEQQQEEEEASGPVKADDAVEEPQDNGDAADEWHELSVQKQEAKMNGNGVTDDIENGAADEENENKEM
ncbi:cytoskeleton-associated protein CAP5.5 [Trypanosoma grayi]|uniref:cytoskeleton-associated protein CAP5.5 n=1 Tax=Trypanosoma grayi TaxID=71804 RepID=UPI0004F40247|nr:cytoskeleton-associated protein CAP5.5 [Trypanosoma grayi]KEG09210.1 cytoskeleton-associated protein CAP5.5 [Trypanosoma grayi]